MVFLPTISFPFIVHSRLGLCLGVLLSLSLSLSLSLPYSLPLSPSLSLSPFLVFYPPTCLPTHLMLAYPQSRRRTQQPTYSTYSFHAKPDSSSESVTFH